MSQTITKNILSEWWINNFEKHFEKNANSQGCWIWIKGKDKDGYGKLSIRSCGKRSYLRAHRVSLAFYKNVEVPPDKFVIHSCDNPSCVNPDHLRIGTQLENEKDKYAKNRQNMHSVLNETQVVEVIEKLLDGYNAKTIADKLKVSPGVVEKIANDKTQKWHYVRKQFPNDELKLINIRDSTKGENAPWSKLTEADVKEIRDKFSQGFSQAELSKMFNTKPSTIHKIVMRQRWKHI